MMKHEKDDLIERLRGLLRECQPYLISGGFGWRGRELFMEIQKEMNDE